MIKRPNCLLRNPHFAKLAYASGSLARASEQEATMVAVAALIVPERLARLCSIVLIICLSSVILRSAEWLRMLYRIFCARSG